MVHYIGHTKKTLMLKSQVLMHSLHDIGHIIPQSLTLKYDLKSAVNIKAMGKVNVTKKKKKQAEY